MKIKIGKQYRVVSEELQELADQAVIVQCSVGLCGESEVFRCQTAMDQTWDICDDELYEAGER